MSEMDKKEDEEILDEEVDTEEEDAEETDEEVTLEDYQKTKAELERAKKKIVALSKLTKKEKESKETSPKKEVSEDDLDAILEKRDFYKSMPDAGEYKVEIEKLYEASGGKFSRQELYAKLSGDSEIEENRKVYGKPAVSGKQSQNESFSAISLSQYDKLSPSAQKEYNAASKAKFGGVKFKE